MELTTLRYFVTVGKELHFHRAAAKLNMTQAPLSAAIRKLEEELETKLFERTSRSVKLTAAGELFLREAEAVLRRAELARQRLDNLTSGRGGRLSIGCNELALNTFLPKLLAQCRTRHGKLQLSLRELETADGLAQFALNQPVRVAVCGVTVGASIYETVECIGVKECARRIRGALAATV